LRPRGTVFGVPSGRIGTWPVRHGARSPVYAIPDMQTPCRIDRPWRRSGLTPDPVQRVGRQE
jgi:hypothetical protein